MSLTSLCFLILCAVAAASTHPTSLEYGKQWEAWREGNWKTYESSEEELKRYNIWVENLRYIDEHNRNAEQHGFTLRMNAFGDLTDTEWSQAQSCHKMSYTMKPNVTKQQRVDLDQPVMENLPVSFDWRKFNVVSQVKNQAEYLCHSCYAFAATGAMESAQAILTGRIVLLSEQQIIDCSRIYANAACQGGSYRFAWDYIMDIGGIDTAESYPYKSREGRCAFQSSYAISTVSGITFIETGNENDLKEVIARMGPVAVAFDHKRRSFQFYYQGIYSDQSCSSYASDLTHEMLVIGYGFSDSGIPYWIVKNSYGLNWGDNGYIYVARGNNMCGIATEAAAPKVSLV